MKTRSITAYKHSSILAWSWRQEAFQNFKVQNVVQSRTFNRSKEDLRPSNSRIGSPKSKNPIRRKGNITSNRWHRISKIVWFNLKFFSVSWFMDSYSTLDCYQVLFGFSLTWKSIRIRTNRRRIYSIAYIHVVKVSLLR